MSNEKSTLEYLSNIQWIDDSKLNDTAYMKHVHDPFSLERMMQKINDCRIEYHMTSLQEHEMKAAAGHCAFAFKNDYPWGTIELDGYKKVVCKCINTECQLFNQCRKGLSAFDEKELLLKDIGERPSRFEEDELKAFFEIGDEFKESLTGRKTSVASASEDEPVHIKEFDDIRIEPTIVKFKPEKVDNNQIDIRKGSSSGKTDFVNWLKADGFLDKAIKKYVDALSILDEFVDKKEYLSFFEIDNTSYLDRFLEEISEKLHTTAARSATKYFRKYVLDLEKNTYLKETKDMEETATGDASVEKEFDSTIYKGKSLDFQKDDSEKEEKTSDADILDDFYGWLISNSYTESASKGYVNAIRTANTFALKKEIWDKEITDDTVVDDGNAKIELMIIEFESSNYYKSSMSNYIVALRAFAKYVNERSVVTDVEIETDDEENISDIDNISRVDDNATAQGFGKFVTVEQDMVIEAAADERIVVNAGPGTGKTYTLIEKLIYLVNECEVDPEEIVVLCFSRAAVEVIENRLKKAADDGKIGMNWHSIEIRTFDSFATRLLAYVEEYEKKLLYDGFMLEALDYDARINTVTDVLSKDRSLIEQCSHLIVDEVQDLVASRARFVIQLIDSLPETSGYTLLGDACQSIYDYQCGSGELSSTDFYNWIFSKQSSAKLFKFDINYRQTSELEELGEKYRHEILEGNESSRIEAANAIFQQVEALDDIDLKATSFEELKKSIGDGSIGILTRTNGQALKISTWFRNADIPHKVQKRNADSALNIWIADLFIDYENDTIDKENFISMFEQNGGYGLDANETWLAIEKSLPEAKARYRIEEILHGIVNNGKDRAFYTTQDNDTIIISNIHRSKGREYENVVLLDDTLFTSTEDEKSLEEHKVSYVAVTRAKNKLCRTNISKQYIKTDKEGEGRAYATRRNFQKKKEYLTHIEIGRGNDIDTISFSESEKIQELFKNPLMILGERAVLVKNAKESEAKGYVSYDVFLEDDMSFGRIAQTSKQFYLSLKRILKKIHNLSVYTDVYPNLYPNRISDIYVDDMYTVITQNAVGLSSIKEYGKYKVLRGITLVGFGQIERDTY